MADVTIKIIEPADNFDLLTLDELKTALGIHDATQDAMLSEMITRYSDVVATLCNRVFAHETVRETWRCFQSDCPGTRLFLSHWPVKEDDITVVEAPRGSVLNPEAYELEERSGKLTLFDNMESEVIVTYQGGFYLPDDAPPALKQACELMIRTGRAQAQAQAVSGIRSLSHKEARVQFFDPNQINRSQQQAAVTGTNVAVNALLMHYVRLQV